MRTHKPHRGLGMEGRIATWYARNTRKDYGEYERLAERIAGRLPASARVLEVAPGPGFLAVELARRGLAVAGLDASHSFVRLAVEHAREAGVCAEFRHGDAAAMPFPDASFDFAVCRAAFKNFTRPLEALNELHRVLKPGGAALVIDLTRDASPRSVAEAVAQMGLGPLDAWITRQIFRFVLMPRAYSAEQLQALAAASAFSGCEVARAPLGAEVTLRKPAPAA
jgi:ubiquinone/menaquinone biosynthesis C-methylase UbiE